MLFLSGCSDEAFMAGSIRYKLTMMFQVDDHLVTASSIQEVGYFDLPPWMLTPTRDDIRLRGDAIVADFGSVGSLVVRKALGFQLPKSCATGRRDGETLSAWFARQRPRLALCEGEQTPFLGKPELLAAPPFASQFPPVVEQRQVNASIAPGFLVLRWEELTRAFGGRVKLVRAWSEPTEEPLHPSSFSTVNWLRPLFNGSIPFFNAVTSRGGYSTFRRVDFSREQYHD
jgi:hypothetical protein